MSYQCYDLFGLGSSPGNGSGDGEPQSPPPPPPPPAGVFSCILSIMGIGTKVDVASIVSLWFLVHWHVHPSLGAHWQGVSIHPCVCAPASGLSCQPDAVLSSRVQSKPAGLNLARCCGRQGRSTSRLQRALGRLTPSAMRRLPRPRTCTRRRLLSRSRAAPNRLAARPSCDALCLRTQPLRRQLARWTQWTRICCRGGFLGGVLGSFMTIAARTRCSRTLQGMLCGSTSAASPCVSSTLCV